MARVLRPRLNEKVTLLSNSLSKVRAESSGRIEMASSSTDSPLAPPQYAMLTAVPTPPRARSHSDVRSSKTRSEVTASRVASMHCGTRCARSRTNGSMLTCGKEKPMELRPSCAALITLTPPTSKLHTPTSACVGCPSSLHGKCTSSTYATATGKVNMTSAQPPKTRVQNNRLALPATASAASLPAAGSAGRSLSASMRCA
mmetsp:Transcript_51024/g.109032  ORF Transcript_51024/g.109032 Transcript_51024/m.109032 type:complete len:201 (+) Transcript_51024:363-965(+)